MSSKARLKGNQILATKAGQIIVAEGGDTKGYFSGGVTSVWEGVNWSVLAWFMFGGGGIYCC